jgi:hypothetical protein
MAILDASFRPSIRRRVLVPVTIGAVLTQSTAAVRPATNASPSASQDGALRSLRAQLRR